jgi:hypothetical protein
MFKQYLLKRKQNKMEKIYDQLETHLTTIATPLDQELLSLEINELKDKYTECEESGDGNFRVTMPRYTGDQDYFTQLTNIKPKYNRLIINDTVEWRGSDMGCEIIFENGYMILVKTHLRPERHEVIILESVHPNDLKYETVKYLDVVFGDVEALKNILDEYGNKEKK